MLLLIGVVEAKICVDDAARYEAICFPIEPTANVYPTRLSAKISSCRLFETTNRLRLGRGRP